MSVTSRLSGSGAVMHTLEGNAGCAEEMAVSCEDDEAIVGDFSWTEEFARHELLQDVHGCHRSSIAVRVFEVWSSITPEQSAAT